MSPKATTQRKSVSDSRVYPLITRDPATGGELLVTRLESPKSGTVIEGRFSLGWIGRLTPDQIDFVGVLLRNRNNIQKLAAELGVAYNTARSRLDDVVEALGGTAERIEPKTDEETTSILDKLAANEISVDEALKQLGEE
jgi:hypothetical protein